MRAWVAGAALIVFALAGPAPAGTKLDGQRMGLGVEPPTETGLPPGKSTRGAGSTCRKWRRVADRLGETHAGVTLRRAVVEKACALAGLDSPDDAVWAWPWLGGAIDAALPPRLHKSDGPWAIRCAEVGRRERCALIYTALLPLGTDEADAMRITTHFVIDKIAGHQRLLWRVLAERLGGDWYGVARRAARPAATEVVRVALTHRQVEEPFDGCSGAGCLMEADVKVGAEAAAQLLDGQALRLTLTPRAGLAFDLVIPATGFRAGLDELARLKRREEHAVIGR